MTPFDWCHLPHAALEVFLEVVPLPHFLFAPLSIPLSYQLDPRLSILESCLGQFLLPFPSFLVLLFQHSTPSPIPLPTLSSSVSALLEALVLGLEVVLVGGFLVARGSV